MSDKGGKMKCLRLKISEHMTSVGEQILCVLEKEQNVNVNVRVFVLERLTAAADFMFNLFQREMEQNKLLDLMLQPHITLHRAGLFIYTTCVYHC